MGSTRKHPRAKCSVCGDEYAIRIYDGCIYAHEHPAGEPGKCEGSGKPPAK